MFPCSLQYFSLSSLVPQNPWKIINTNELNIILCIRSPPSSPKGERSPDPLLSQQPLKSRSSNFFHNFKRTNCINGGQKKLFSLCTNQASQPRSKGTFILYFVRANEAIESNQHKEKRIFFGCHLCNKSMWVELVDSLLCFERFFPGHSGFSLSPKTNIL